MLARSPAPLEDCWQTLLTLMHARAACEAASPSAAQAAPAAPAAEHEARLAWLQTLSGACGQAQQAIQQATAVSGADGPWSELEGTAARLADRAGSLYAELAAQPPGEGSAGRFEWVDGTLTR